MKGQFGWSRIGTFPKQAETPACPADSHCGPNVWHRRPHWLRELISEPGKAGQRSARPDELETAPSGGQRASARKVLAVGKVLEQEAGLGPCNSTPWRQISVLLIKG